MGDLGRRLRSVWRALRRSKQLDADMQEEMRFHIQMEAERLRRVEGLDPQEARRQAHVSFGGVEKYKEEGREARGFRWLDSLSLDARLGVRMLAKHRWLTLVGGVAMAVAIAIGASAFIVIGVLLDPALPLPQGDRIVTVKYERASTGRADQHVLHAFAAWRDHLTTVEQLSAFRTVRHNLVVSNAAPEPVAVAEITASAFGLAQAQPLLGRYLLASDEQPNAAPVVVIGYDAWRTRFGADPGVVGRTVQLAGTPHTIVGIMPAGFGFPIDHQFWIPLRLDALKYRPWQGPELDLFGRLAPGATIGQAQAELAATGRAGRRHPPGRQRSPAACRGPVHAGTSRLDGYEAAVGVEGRAIARRRAVVRRRRQPRDSALRAHRDAPRRDRGSYRARREPRTHPVATLHRGAGADGPRRGRRPGPLHPRVGLRAVVGGRQWRLAVLGAVRALSRQRGVRGGAGGRCGVDHGCAAGPQGDRHVPVGESAGVAWSHRDASRLDVDDAHRRASGRRGGDPSGGGVPLLARREDAAPRTFDRGRAVRGCQPGVERRRLRRRGGPRSGTAACGYLAAA